MALTKTFSELEMVIKSFAGFGETENEVIALSKVALSNKESVAVAFKDRLSITIVAAAELGAAVVLPEKAIKSTSAGGVAVELPESVKPVAAIPGPLIVTNLVVTL